MNAIENDLWDVYRHLLSRGASPETARESVLALARDRLPQENDYVVRDTVARVIAYFRTRSRGAGTSSEAEETMQQPKPEGSTQ